MPRIKSNERRSLTDYTQQFLRGGKSKYGDNVLYAPGSTVKSLGEKDGALFLEGWASTNAVDFYNEIVEPSAFESSLDWYLYNGGILMFMHDWFGMPIGKISDLSIKDTGLWINNAKILPTKYSGGEDAIMLIREGLLKHLSIGFRIKSSSHDEDSGITTITDLDLMEISVVHTPANPFCDFEETSKRKLTIKSLTLQTPEGVAGHKQEAKMPNTDLLALEKKLDDFIGEAGKLPTAIEAAESKVADLTKKHDDLMGIMKTVQEKADQFGRGLITEADFRGFKDSVESDLKGITASMQEANVAKKQHKIHYKDWAGLSKPGAYAYLRDDAGHPLSPMEQKAYHFFTAPVDYKSSPDGEFLRKIRDLYDVALLTYQYFKGKNKGYYNPQNLKSYGLLRDAMEVYDPEFAKAMYSTGTGVGDEWVPTLMSSELLDLIGLTPGLSNFIPHFNMTSDPYPWPLKTSHATAYIASEASVNNPTELHKSEMGTGNITFTTDTHAVCIPCSPQLIEDAIVEMVTEIRNEVAYALTEGEENAIINGDTTATHRDTNTVTGADDIARAYMGLRYLAIDKSNTFDTQSASAGVGDAATTFGAEDIRYCRQLLASLGTNPKDCLYVTSISVFFYMLSMSEFAKANEFGYTSSWYTGELPIVDGSQVYLSGQMRETLGAAGLADSASTHKGILCLNTRKGLKMGERRGVTIEFEKNILTQQWNFVATRRQDMQDMQPSIRHAVSYGYNIE